MPDIDIHALMHEEQEKHEKRKQAHSRWLEEKSADPNDLIDAYVTGHRQVLLSGGVVSASSRAFVTVSGGGGLDVQLAGNALVPSGTETTFTQGSRLSVMRVC